MQTLTSSVLKKISQLGSELDSLGYDISIAPKAVVPVVENNKDSKISGRKRQAKAVKKSWAAARELHEQKGIPMREARRIIAEQKRNGGNTEVQAKETSRSGGIGSGQASYWRKIHRIRANVLKESGKEITFNEARKIYAEKQKLPRRTKAA